MVSCSPSKNSGREKCHKFKPFSHFFVLYLFIWYYLFSFIYLMRLNDFVPESFGPQVHYKARFDWLASGDY